MSVQLLLFLFTQKIKLSSGSPVISLFGGASPSTWPVWSTLLWQSFTLLVTMVMKVRTCERICGTRTL